MDSERNRRRVIARAAITALLAGILAACADQASGPAPVYMKGAAPAPLPVRVATPLPLPPLPPTRYVTVQNGQSIDRIAHLYHVSRSAIVAANGLKPPYKLLSGTRLKIPSGGDTPVGEAAHNPPSPQFAVVPPTPPPIPLPPARPETLAPPSRLAAEPPSSPQTPSSPQKETAGRAEPSVPAVPPATAKAAPDVIPLDGPPPKEIAAAQSAPPVLPPRNAAAALPLPGEASVDWGSADAAQAVPGNTAGRFPWPVRGRVLASYGSTTGGVHNDGINIAAPRGTPVRAIDAGTVAYAGNEVKGYGNLVLIRHANGWISAYAHLDQLAVKVGDKIAAGQAFARVGESGGVGEPQLHFELRRGKKPVDPKEFLAPTPSAAMPGENKAG